MPACLAIYAAHAALSPVSSPTCILMSCSVRTVAALSSFNVSASANNPKTLLPSVRYKTLFPSPESAANCSSSKGTPYSFNSLSFPK